MLDSTIKYKIKDKNNKTLKNNIILKDDLLSEEHLNNINDDENVIIEVPQNYDDNLKISINFSDKGVNLSTDNNQLLENAHDNLNNLNSTVNNLIKTTTNRLTNKSINKNRLKSAKTTHSSSFNHNQSYNIFNQSRTDFHSRNSTRYDSEFITNDKRSR